MLTPSGLPSPVTAAKGGRFWQKRAAFFGLLFLILLLFWVLGGLNGATAGDLLSLAMRGVSLAASSRWG